MKPYLLAAGIFITGFISGSFTQPSHADHLGDAIVLNDLEQIKCQVNAIYKFTADKPTGLMAGIQQNVERCF